MELVKYCHLFLSIGTWHSLVLHRSNFRTFCWNLRYLTLQAHLGRQRAPRGCQFGQVQPKCPALFDIWILLRAPRLPAFVKLIELYELGWICAHFYHLFPSAAQPAYQQPCPVESRTTPNLRRHSEALATVYASTLPTPFIGHCQRVDSKSDFNRCSTDVGSSSSRSGY